MRNNFVINESEIFLNKNIIIGSQDIIISSAIKSNSSKYVLGICSRCGVPCICF